MTTDDRPPVTDDARAVREAAMNLYRAMRRANPDAWAEVDKVEDWTYWDDIARTAQVTLAAARAETTAEDAEDAVEALAVELFERSHEPSFSDDKRGMDEAREWARRIARDLLATAPTETTTATTEDAARVLTDIEAAVEDYRTVFPTPEPLPPNLDLAVRAARLLARPTPSREDLARTILSAIAQHGEITASQIDGINAAAHAVLDLLERAQVQAQALRDANIAAQALENAWHDLRVIEATGGHIIDPAAWLHERAARIRGGAPAPDEARADAVRKVLHDETGGCTCHPSYVARRREEPGCAWHDIERAIPDVIAAARAETTKVVRR